MPPQPSRPVAGVKRKSVGKSIGIRASGAMVRPRFEPSPRQARHRVQAAPDQLDLCSPPGPAALGGLRAVVRDSWRRSLSALGSPGAAAAPLALDGAELEDYRRRHLLAAVMPVIGRLLVQPARDTG